MFVVFVFSTQVNARVSVGSALAVELFITFQLVFTVFATCDHNRHDLKGSSALAIGLSVCVGHLFAVSALILWGTSWEIRKKTGETILHYNKSSVTQVS